MASANWRQKYFWTQNCTNKFKRKKENTSSYNIQFSLHSFWIFSNKYCEPFIHSRRWSLFLQRQRIWLNFLSPKCTICPLKCTMWKTSGKDPIFNHLFLSKRESRRNYSLCTMPFLPFGKANQHQTIFFKIYVKICFILSLQESYILAPRICDSCCCYCCVTKKRLKHYPTANTLSAG